ncbi:MAG: hypothetical protein KBC35_03925 [Candidatus Pacebacteria bacterium]|jgi:hypothetical protein|nr:hypothetical protein [Candidatus Paceibacterota bacterium]
MSEGLFLNEKYILIFHSQLKNIPPEQMVIMLKMMFGVSFSYYVVVETCTRLCQRKFLRQVPEKTYELTDLGWERLKTIHDSLSAQYLQAS